MQPDRGAEAEPIGVAQPEKDTTRASAAPEEGVAMCNHRVVRIEVLLICIKSALPPAFRAIADQVLQQLT
ncbi:hypothetical protein PIB30_004966 [Stylosanthes scabra]|uniref:Uncharacterized protein n=1 Tax=Stylosanthes scabra TaxID=79078 RepID=A0ABU6X222_9FABA|nr:hypothetical protein [Stylosanthes scabra]